MPQFICILEPARPDLPENPSAQDTAALEAHLAYYQKLLDKGALILAGRTEEPPFIGVLVYEAPTREDAISIAAQDPAVTKGVLNCRVQSYNVALRAK